MFEFFRALFGTDFMPHLYCLRGDPAVLWLSVVSDMGIALAYFAIPVLLFQVVQHREDRAFRKVALLFVGFIAACGMTHLLSIWTIWYPMYRLESVTKAATAVISVTTALVLVRLRPVILKLPSVAEMEAEIVKRRLAQEEARDKDERFRTYVEGVRDYAIFMIDLEGFIQTWNVGAERSMGYTAEEAISRHFSSFYTEKDRDGDVPVLALDRAIETGQSEVEAWQIRKDGSQFWARTILRPSFDASRTLRGFAMITRDLTEPRAIEARYQTLLEAMPDAIVIVNSGGAIDFINTRAEELFGYPRAHVIGEAVDMFVPPRVRQVQASYLERLFADAVHPAPDTPPEIFGLRKDGREFPLEFSVRPLDMNDGQVLLFAIRDLTERRNTEARFRTLMEAAPDAIFMYSEAGRIVYMNRRAEEMFGFTRGEILGKSVEVVVPERFREERRKAREKLFRLTGTIGMGAGGEYICLRKDGMEFAVEASITPVEMPEGPVLLTSIRDVTERKKTEARFRALLDSAPDAMVISGTNGLIELTNLEAERLFGYSREELSGQSVEMLIPQDLHAGYERDSERFFQGANQREMGAGIELRARRRDGTEFPVEIRFSPLEGANGISMTAAIRDVSERKKSETRFRALLESAPDAMVIVSSDGLIQLANLQTEKLFGYGRAELIGQSVDIMVPTDLRAAHGGHREVFFGSPKVREMGADIDLMALRKDGTQFPVEISLSPLEGPDGVSVTAAIRDITDRKTAEAHLLQKMKELNRSNEALEQFAHIASHDLQEPLRMVASYTQLLAKRYVGRLDSDADEFIGFAIDGTKRMKRLIEDLLVYSRAGKGSPPLHAFPSGDALLGAIKNLHAAIEESSAWVTYDQLPVIVGDESQMVQIFQNLIGNAIKYRGDRTPRIHISWATVGHEWVFSVADNGIGIEPRFFERIFVIFQRLHGREEYEGTGIGLAICKRILQQQGGRVWVESEPGKGSIFHFSLPVR